MYHSLLTHSSAEGHIGYFQLLAIIHKTSRNIWKMFSFCGGRIAGTGTVWLYVNCMIKYIKICQHVFQSGCIILCSLQQYMRVPVAPILANTWYCYFKFLAMLRSGHSYCEFNWHFPNDNDVGSHSMSLFVISISFSMKCMSNLWYWKNRLFFIIELCKFLIYFW